ncbi:MAG: ATP-dependent protease ATPase subunit HslU [Planctomycetota bacterium]
MKELTPVEIVAALDRHIVGQMEAKRAVAIAIRNRWRRRQLGPEIRDEVLPKNIILIGSTGVGKTEIARRVSQLVSAPFIKVEASKYTEVGYHGRDVESLVRDLVDVAVALVRGEELAEVHARAQAAAEERILDLLVPPTVGSGSPEERDQRDRTRDTFRRKLAAGELDAREIEIAVDSKGANPLFDMFSGAGMEQLGLDLQGLMQRSGRSAPQPRRMTVAEARPLLAGQEAEKLIDQDKVNQKGLRLAEDSGIVFLDEIDKIVTKGGGTQGPEVSREGVQRDLLPIVEGSTVMTRYGAARTDHMLFIGAGAFHGSKPTDLIPELQGRFPIRVELSALGREDFLRILREPQNSLPRQYAALLGTEGVTVDFQPEGLARIAEIAWDLNQSTQDIGARRLYTLFERILERPLFEAPDLIPPGARSFSVDAAFVDSQLGGLLADRDQSSYIL